MSIYSTLLLSIRAFGFREEHRRVWDILKVYKGV